MAKIIRRAIPIGAIGEFITPPPPGSGACFRVRGASPLPGSFLLACLFSAEKWIFPENFCTLHKIDLLQLPQTPSKFNLANKKDQVSFSSDHHHQQDHSQQDPA